MTDRRIILGNRVAIITPLSDGSGLFMSINSRGHTTEIFLSPSEATKLRDELANVLVGIQVQQINMRRGNNV